MSRSEEKKPQSSQGIYERWMSRWRQERALRFQIWTTALGIVFLFYLCLYLFLWICFTDTCGFAYFNIEDEGHQLKAWQMEYETDFGLKHPLEGGSLELSSDRSSISRHAAYWTLPPEVIYGLKVTFMHQDGRESVIRNLNGYGEILVSSQGLLCRGLQRSQEADTKEDVFFPWCPGQAGSSTDETGHLPAVAEENPEPQKPEEN